MKSVPVEAVPNDVSIITLFVWYWYKSNKLLSLDQRGKDYNTLLTAKCFAVVCFWSMKELNYVLCDMKEFNYVLFTILVSSNPSVS